MQRGKPLQRRTPMPRATTPMARTQMSRRKTARLAQSGREFLAAKAVVWARDEGRCVVCGDRGIPDFHHRLPRGMGGSSRAADTHTPARLVVLCREHHRWAEEHRTEAEAMRLIVRHGLVDLTGIPVLYRGGWVLLDDEGGRTAVPAPGEGVDGW